MKKHFQRMVLAGLFAGSVGSAAVVLTALTLAPPAFASRCGTCGLKFDNCFGGCSCNINTITEEGTCQATQ